MAINIMHVTKNRKNNTFPPWDSLGLLVCYIVHFSVLETVGIVCVAICLRSNHKMTGLQVFAVQDTTHSSQGDCRPPPDNLMVSIVQCATTINILYQEGNTTTKTTNLIIEDCPSIISAYSQDQRYLIK